MNDDDKCRCGCHSSPGMVHFFPCCMRCPECGEAVAMHLWRRHLAACEAAKIAGTKVEGDKP